MTTKMRDFDAYLMERLADPERVIGYLQAALEDYQTFNDVSVFLLSLRTAMAAQGRFSERTKQTDMLSEAFAHVLNAEEAPRIDTLSEILKVIGGRLTIEPLETLNTTEGVIHVNTESARHADVAD